MLSKPKFRLPKLLIIICVVLSASCANINQEPPDTPSNQPTSLLNSSSYQVDLSCIKLNCWADIFPDSTTAIKAQSLLETLYGKNSVQASSNTINWQTSSSESQSQFGLLSIDKQGMVNEIYITFPESQLVVAQLIDQVEAPTFVYIARAFSSESKCAGSFISYTNLGLIAWLYPNNLSVGVQPTQFVQSIMLIPLEKVGTSTFYDSVMLKWEGYKEYCDLIDK